jgi:RimJ/RimL family protein N-acetyltransferase
LSLPYDSPLGPTLETGRLILRPPVDGDFDGFCAFHADEKAMTWLGGVSSPPVVWRIMRTIAGSWALDGFGMFSVIEKASGKWIGRIGPLQPHGWPDREVGWGLLTEAQGKGYAMEAAIASMDFAVDILGWDQVIHTINPGNAASAALAGRIGSQIMRQARLPDPYADQIVDVWGQTGEAWRENRENLLKNNT